MVTRVFLLYYVASTASIDLGNDLCYDLGRSFLSGFFVMYIRLRKNKTGTTTVYLLESIRPEGKVHSTSKVIKCFGSSSDSRLIDQWKKDALSLKLSFGEQKISSRDFLKIQKSEDIKTCKVKELGVKFLYQNIFDNAFGKMKIKSVDMQLLSDLVIMRIAQPVSKLRTSNLSSNYDIENMTPNKIYKLMDNLDDDAIESIKKHVWTNSKKLLGTDAIKIMFYDLTTIYFEATSRSELKEFGYSKDGKSQHVQISLALIVSQSGMPIGYEIFKGNSFEGATLIPTLNKLKAQYKIEDVTVVADSAMLSEANIKALIEHEFKFIVSARVKNMSAKLANQMIAEDDYIISGDDLKYKTIKLKDRDIVFCRSENRQRKDEYDRQKSLDKILKMVGKPVKSGLRGVLKKTFVKINKQESVLEIDEAKLEEHKRFDGYFGFISNTNLEASEIINQYRGLWQVEQSFRITKHNLKIRPVYHYVDRRIKAHFALCYLTLAVIRTLEYKLKLLNLYVPIEQLNTMLEQMKKISMTTGGQKCEILTDIPKELKFIFYGLNISLPKKYKVIL
jgi:transposase